MKKPELNPKDNQPKKSTSAGLHAGHRERLKKRFVEQTPDSFNDHELLELLLFYVLPRRDTNPIAHDLINQFGGSLAGVFSATPEELQQVKGIGETASRLFPLLVEINRRCRINQKKGAKLDTIEDICLYLEPYFYASHDEMAYLLCCNNRNQVLSCDMLNKGDDLSVAFNSRQLVQLALRHRASWVVLAHNHPSGLAMPSAEDVAVTQRCVKLLEPFSISLRDHIIFADDDYISLKQTNVF